MDFSWIFWLLLVGVPATMALAIAVMVIFVKPHRWLWVAGATSTVMGYTIPIAGIFPSVNLLAGLAALKGVKGWPLWRTTWMRAAAAMAVIQLLAAAWSPNPVSAVREFIYLLPFFLLCGAAFRYGQSNPRGLVSLYVLVLWTSVVQAALVVLFRLAPSVEASFITSRVAGLFISPNVIASLFDGTPNNLFDAAKSGGLFVNANTAATFAGCCAMLGWYLGSAVRRRDLQLIGVLNWVAVFFTGSKAGAMCAFIVPMSVMLFQLARGQRPSLMQIVTFCFVLAVGAVILPVAWELYRQTDFTHASTETLNIRQRIWSFAWGMFKKHPLQGLGHGGWEVHFPFYAYAQGLSPNYPPHNMFLLLWSKAGVFSALAGLLFALSFMATQLRMAWLARRDLAGLPLAVFAAFLWTFIQAQGENFGILGEPHITTLLALAAGGVAALMQYGRPAQQSHS